MSIKAYDWFITDLSIWEATDKIRNAVEPIFMKGMYDLTRLAAEFVAQDPDATWEDSPLWASNSVSTSKKMILDQSGAFLWLPSQVYKHMKACQEVEVHSLSKASIGYQVVLMRGPNPGQIVFRAYSESREYTEALRGQDWCQDFSYWDNTDKDDDVSEEDWEVRAKFWNGTPNKPIASMSLMFNQPTESETFFHLRENTDLFDYMNGLDRVLPSSD